MRQRRKCLYKNCGHNQGNNVHHCKFHSFPKEATVARRWLHLSGVYDKTPKKIAPHWCICSCHFPGGRNKDNFPDDFIEEVDDLETLLSPPTKARRLAEEALTPSTRAAVDSLLTLPTAAPNLARTPKSKRKNATYSPSRRLWSLRNKTVHAEKRRALFDIMDFSDLGVETLPERINLESVVAMNSGGVQQTNSHTIIVQSDTLAIPLGEVNLDENDIDIISTSVEKSPVVRRIDTSFMASTPLVQDNPQNTLDENNNDVDGKSLGPTPSEEFHVATSLDTELNDSTIHVTSQSCETEVKTTRSIGIQCSRPFLCYARCKLLSSTDFKFYTGVTQEIFEVIYEYLGGDEICSHLKYSYGSNTPTRRHFDSELSTKDKMFLTLLRLRRGIPFRDLKVLFNISSGYASKIFYTWIRLMSLQFKKLENAMFVPTFAQQANKPQCFEMFENLRVVIDAAEFRMEKPKNLQQNSNCFSDYKSYTTIKFLIGISCFGGLSFISEGYEGSISDREILLKSGFLDHIEPGDGVMADRGFDMEDIADERDFDLYLPAFLQRGRTHFTGRELLLSRAIAESRIHVERFISRLKEFRLIRYLIPNTTLAVASDIVKVCAFLVNFQCPFIKLKDGE